MTLLLRHRATAHNVLYELYFVEKHKCKAEYRFETDGNTVVKFTCCFMTNTQ